MWERPSVAGAVPPPPPETIAPRPWAAAAWMGTCALAGLAGATSVFLPYVFVDDEGYAGIDPALHDWLTEAGASTTGVLVVLLGSLLTLGAAAVMMRALDSDKSTSWRLIGTTTAVAGVACAWGGVDAYRAVEKVFGSPDPVVWGPGIPVALLAATVLLIVGVALMILPSR